MKLFPVLLLLSFIVSCSKKNEQIIPPPELKQDTLTSGWSKLKLNDDNLEDIFFVDSDTGYVAGNNGVYKSINGGLNWQKIAFFRGVNIAATKDGKIFILSRDSLFTSFNSGSTFSGTSMGINAYFFDIYFTGKDTGYIPTGNSLLHTTDGGQTWTNVNPITGLNLTVTRQPIPYFINETTGWISDGATVFKTNGSIHSWTQCIFDIPPSGAHFITLFANSSNIVYAGLYSGTGAVIYKSINGGSNFSLLTEFSSSSGGFADIHFSDDNNGYLSIGNKIYATTNGGISWTNVVTLGNGKLTEIHFTDANHGWACGDSGTILIFKK